MSLKSTFLAYLQHYANQDLAAVAALLADDIQLRDWKISVTGKAAALDETARNFANATSIEIDTLRCHEAGQTVVGELRILVDGVSELYVVDIADFDRAGKISAIRAYLGRGDLPLQGSAGA